MNRRPLPGLLGLGAFLLAAAPTVAQMPIAIRAGTVIDGKGGVQRGVTILVAGSHIQRVDPASGPSATYDFSRFTILPGLIDTHVHMASHFGKDGRPSNEGETPAEAILHAAENAYVTLMAGFTTVQSIGSREDVPLRTSSRSSPPRASAKAGRKP